jgi:hypothetical protein
MVENFIKKFPNNVREMSGYRRQKEQEISAKEN